MPNMSRQKPMAGRTQTRQPVNSVLDVKRLKPETLGVTSFLHGTLFGDSLLPHINFMEFLLVASNGNFIISSGFNVKNNALPFRLAVVMVGLRH